MTELGEMLSSAWVTRAIRDVVRVSTAAGDPEVATTAAVVPATVMVSYSPSFR
jgi:hypothetical protein